MKTIMITGMLIGIAGLCGCNREPSPAPTATAQPEGAAAVQGAAAGTEPAVDLKRVTSTSQTQHQFKMVVHLPPEESPSKQTQ